ncbi:hypothetical protein JOQ06_002999, partial [Pogonophryne albipinna]
MNNISPIIYFHFRQYSEAKLGAASILVDEEKEENQNHAGKRCQAHCYGHLQKGGGE